MNFKQRSELKELMDDLDCDGPVVDQSLAELDTINYWLGGDWVSLKGLKKLIDKNKNPFSIIDLGCGSGTLLAQMAHEYQDQLNSGVGIDANAYILKYARDAQAAFKQLSFIDVNVLDAAEKNFNCDILHASLFLHHFSHDELVMSVMRGFRRKEWIRIFEAAGIKDYQIRWKWAFRWQIIIKF